MKERMNVARKIIQLITRTTRVSDTSLDFLYALADDGTVWKHFERGWLRLDPLPQDTEIEHPSVLPGVTSPTAGDE
jgi:hypothetical protein